jgi:hypothetical protein
MGGFVMRILPQEVNPNQTQDGGPGDRLKRADKEKDYDED